MQNYFGGRPIIQKDMAILILAQMVDMVCTLIANAAVQHSEFEKREGEAAALERDYLKSLLLFMS